MTDDDIPKLTDLAGIWSGDDRGSRCRVCRDLTFQSSEDADRASLAMCGDCLATIADPETLRLLAEWFDNPNQTKAVVCRFAGKPFTLGMIFRDVANAIDAQADGEVAAPSE